METDTSMPGPLMRSPGDGRWLARLVRSRGFAWGVSIGLHVVVFGVLLKVGFASAPATRRFIIPEARLAGGPVAAAPMNTAIAPLKLSEGGAPVGVAGGQAPRLDELSILSVESSTAGGERVVASAPAFIGLSLPGAGAGVGGGAGGQGGSGGGSGVGPVSRFFGQAGTAYKVTYVVDVSASLMEHTQEIHQELQESINALVPSQQFHIVLAMGRQIKEMEPRRLVPANANFKSVAADFIHQVAGKPEPGKADPIEAMSRAFATGPELIYFLTDGDYPDIESDFEAVLKRLNAHGDTKITIIGFDPSPAPRALLERIARDHGGNCRFVGMR